MRVAERETYPCFVAGRLAITAAHAWDRYFTLITFETNLKHHGSLSRQQACQSGSFELWVLANNTHSPTGPSGDDVRLLLRLAKSFQQKARQSVI